jgi:Undecaprenyl-phosphate glucose phosphotransferase
MKFASGMLKEHSSALAAALRGADWVLLAGTGWTAHWVYLGTWSMRAPYELALVLGVLLAALIFPQFGLYRAWRGASLLDEVKQLTLALVTVAIAMLAIAYFSKAGAVYSRVWALTWVATAWVVLISSRILLRGLLSWARKKGYNRRRIVIVGGRDLGREVASRIISAPWTGLEILGFFCDEERQPHEQQHHHPATIGRVADVGNYVAKNEVDQVWLAMPLKEEDRVREVLDILRHAIVDIRYVPDLFGFRLINHSITEVAGIPLMNLSVSPMEGMSRFIKALEDRLFALVLLLLVSPLMVFIALAVKVSSPGPVFYRQERVGWNGERFDMLKFRSMRVDAERNGIAWGGAKDKPVTAAGAFLRRTSLDELPQLINVLKGEMSIVGPRPERPVFVEQFKEKIPDYMKKHLVKAGITGWAQINGLRGDTDIARRIEYDLYYIENWSLWFDIKIILLTIFRGFWSKSAY